MKGDGDLTDNCLTLNKTKKNLFIKNDREIIRKKIAKENQRMTDVISEYNFNKDVFFTSLVHEPAAVLKKWFFKIINDFEEMPLDYKRVYMYKYYNEKLQEILDYIYDHYEVFRMITCHSNKTVYRDYIEQLIEVETRCSERYYEALIKEGRITRPVAERFMHVVEETYFKGIFKTVQHDMKREEAKRYIEELGQFFTIGWNYVSNHIVNHA